MYISKKVVVALSAVLILEGIFVYQGLQSKTVHAQLGVVPYSNARYVFSESESNPRIFDTSTGIYRVWSPIDAKSVTTYDFNVHKVVAVNSLFFR